jgi:hypothetical protein
MEMKMKMKFSAFSAVCLMSLNLGVAHAAFDKTADSLSKTLNFSGEVALAADELQADRKSDKKVDIKIEKRGNMPLAGEHSNDDQLMSFFSSGQAHGMHIFPKLKSIKGAPYSAEVISETVQKLSDGNIISNKMTSTSFRDSQGRTREERRNSKGEITEITISRSADELIRLNVKNKTATKMATRFSFSTKHNGKGPGEIITEKVTKLKGGGEIIELETAGAGAKNGERNVIVKRLEKALGDEKKNAGTQMKTLTVDVRGAGPDSEQLKGAMDEPFMRLFSDVKWASKRQTKALGNREFDGIKAEGKLVSFEIPAGEIGNAQAILVTDETWISPELQMTLYSKHSDPRSGERIYRLNNVKRDEVAAAMFEIPSEYTVRDIGKNMQREIRMEINDKLKKGDVEKK